MVVIFTRRFEWSGYNDKEIIQEEFRAVSKEIRLSQSRIATRDRTETPSGTGNETSNGQIPSPQEATNYYYTLSPPPISPHYI
jgi:hypothetical protein